MIYIPGGKFMMGRDDGEVDERPAHEVEVKPFKIDKYEVTNRQYKKFIDATRYPAPATWKDRAYLPDEATLPVTHVTWQDAAKYAAWAGKRLPSEEEWEYAARGGSKQYRYPWGNEWRDGYANVNRQDRPKPAPVDSFEQDVSPFGVYGLAGNVSEWVNDSAKYYVSGRSINACRGKECKVFRGGNFSTDAKSSTTTYRWYDDLNQPTNDTLSTTGFRCAKDADK